ncbi:pheromone A receptor-domain-containing protein [Mycena maculata]|uniref:Pheromone A receptor-domain-containing protein n=1 Tax=Mycena maculata TaxID=230809 RepID=A0AAD7I040_9AGAR|nr:pheromone A receptor-domain-containing protein [Mycena maculata]
MDRFQNTDPTYPLFPIFAFLGFLLPLVPLLWHFQAWNSGTCWYIFWASSSCLNQFVNSIVWSGNTLNSAPAWCEISIRIMMGASVGLPAASLCINRRLYHIASVRCVVITKAEKRRAVLIDSLICGLFPAIYVALQYIVQGHRFNIFEDIGCYPDLYNSLPTYFISSMWPVVIGLVSAVYCVLSLRAFSARRAAFAQFLSAHNALTPARYLRLSGLALTELLLTVPLAAFTIYLNATASALSPWVSFADTHFDYSRVEQIPHFVWAANESSKIAVELTRWASPACALIFFAFFGFAVEARRNYALFFAFLVTVFWKGAARIGIKRPTVGFLAAKSSTASSKGGLSSGGGYTKPKPAPPHAISLPAYSPSGTGSFTAGASQFTTDLKRTESFASSSASTSRFVERLPVDEEKDTSGAAHTPPPETPASATSFASSATTAQFALPLHVGWHEWPYPAVYPGAEGSAQRPASDAYSTHLPDATHNAEEDAAAYPPRGRSLV